MGLRAGDAETISLRGGNGSGHVGAMVPGVGHGAGVQREVVAVDIVDEAVAVIVAQVAGDLAGIGPQVGREIRMGDIHAGVDDADHHFAGGRTG